VGGRVRIVKRAWRPPDFRSLFVPRGADALNYHDPDNRRQGTVNESTNKIDIQIQRESDRADKSKLRQYQDLVIGSRSLWTLVKFELIQLLVSRIPGALGLFLRKLFYPAVLCRVGKGVVFGVDVWFRHPHKIRIGDGAIIDDGALIDAKGSANEGVTIGPNCYIGRGTILSCKEGDIVLGPSVNLSTWCNISSNSKIVIGEKTLLGPYAGVFATMHKFDEIGAAILDQGWTSEGVTIGPNCWLGSRVSVLDGVTVGANVVVGAGAVVTDDLPDNVIAVGVPAKVLKRRA